MREKSEREKWNNEWGKEIFRVREREKEVEINKRTWFGIRDKR